MTRDEAADAVEDDDALSRTTFAGGRRVEADGGSSAGGPDDQPTPIDVVLDGDVRPRWLNDVRIIVEATIVVYGLFILLGLAAGLNFNGIVSTLQQVTLLAASFALVVLALNLHWGYTGLFNIGVAGFMAVGAYTMALVTAAPDATFPGLGLPLWVGVGAGLIASGLVGFLVALPALRLRADYFAIVTLAAAEVIRLVFNSSALHEFSVLGVELGTGSGQGMSFPNLRNTVSRTLLYVDGDPAAGPTLFGRPFVTIGDGLELSTSVVEGWVYTVVLVALVAFVFVVITRIGNSPFGRMLKAIREDELAARSLGKNTDRVKIKVFVLGCVFMGLAGIVWQGRRGYIDPNLFLPIITFYIFIALIIGGSGSNTGSVVGALLFAGLLFEGPPFVQRIVDATFDLPQPPTVYDGAVALADLDPGPLLGYAVAELPNLRFVFFGAVLIALMIFRPDGILGHRNEPASPIDLRRERPPQDREATVADGGKEDE
ncbi:branched-chain amino acid ABC transporter permease [Natronobacterium gregoryi]|uniref:ABC-type branched-chain amino acid transport system, permease component n=2 Tax=Natronobacterium gregoryi TaxID=44930 RepID=L0AGE5_NATGS|nr:branched-chain amino acid ABC transporter permease [Natronobacterium gregoryi]AFZ72120.1 ABC-type branched-chain amino acid transport system, permease component [Natronobacterium gregoryi SP2]ELY62851.1 inner-membrane translocator [Natronobacterium gregoryi SP2]PLK19278.1 branched-chain amino acid ABC transporter permease [Natronobacterium gregoryi SP2]SFJ55116.1 amino acid/amide ABC transporter membrane protein 2, HAAT family [Natronobacterium gregoryi]